VRRVRSVVFVELDPFARDEVLENMGPAVLHPPGDGLLGRPEVGVHRRDSPVGLHVV
jgi:hypothetical protein